MTNEILQILYNTSSQQSNDFISLFNTINARQKGQHILHPPNVFQDFFFLAFISLEHSDLWEIR